MSDAKVPQAPSGLNWSVKALLVTFGPVVYKEIKSDSYSQGLASKKAMDGK
jgi:hypothetical protein